MSSLTNTLSTFITLTDDEGNNIAIKKAYLKTEAFGTYFIIRWHDKELYSLQFEKALLYADITAPASSDVDDLKTIIDGWIGNTSGTFVGKLWQKLSYTGVKNSSNKVFIVTDAHDGDVAIYCRGVLLEKDNNYGYTSSGNTHTLAADLDAPEPTDAFSIWGNK